jgi:hypothetical protein
VDERDPVRMDRRRLRQKAQRRERDVIGGRFAEQIPVRTASFGADFGRYVHCALHGVAVSF